MKTFKQFLRENSEPMHDPRVIHHTPDEIWDTPIQNRHGKHIVHQEGDYQIGIEKPGDATHATLYHRGQSVGGLDTEKIHKDFGKGHKPYLNVISAHVGSNDDEDDEGNRLDNEHAGRGFGTKLYKTLLKHSHPDVAGIASKESDRTNTEEIPHIYKKLNSVQHTEYNPKYRDNDKWHVIHKENE
jgi:hypothetical protein